MPYSYAERPTLTCPACQRAFAADVYLIVALDERPDLADRIRAGTLHTIPCPACGREIELDAPLLLYHPGGATALSFSPAQNTSSAQDQEHAAGLLGHLQASLGDAWQDAWLAEGLPGIPRQLLPTVLDGGDPQAALHALLEQAQQEMERLRQEDPERFAELEAAARQMLEGEGAGEREEEGEDLADRLIAWIKTPDWQASEDYLRAQEAELLTDAAEAELERLRRINPTISAIPEHQALLRRAREVGIAAMYAEFNLQRLLKRVKESGPLGDAVWRFLQADDAAAAALLQSEAPYLLTLDAGSLLRQLAEAAQSVGDADFAARVNARLEQQQAARLGNVPGARFEQTGQRVTAQTNIGGDVCGTLLSGSFSGDVQVGARYEIGVANFTAIGDNAVTLNVLNFGAVTLPWQRPAMLRPDLTERAVWRQDDLEKLRTAQDVAIVGKRESRAVSGMPGVGKSTLAALYAAECAADPRAYPGGILWLQLGHTYTTEESVRAALSNLAALVYGLGGGPLAPVRGAPPTREEALRALQNALFTPDAVQKMLSGHGRLLVVVDDLWERALWPVIRRALPPEAHVLVTTREERVAREVGQSLPLDVLTHEDAQALIAQELPTMPAPLAERLMGVVGRHPMALRIALGDLNPADPPAEWAAALDRIAHRLAHGLGVNPSTLDDVAPARRLDAILAYSYDALAVRPSLQICFRALGSFAPDEAEFPTAAVAALIGRPEEETRELLKALRERNLLRRVEQSDRWRQHVILHAYALEQQSPAERLNWAERHARHYLAQMRAADNAQTYYTMRPDLPNLRHAFGWAVGAGRALGLAQDLLSNCANLLQSQNLGTEYLNWAERVRDLAFQIGGPHERGRALTSLGNALQAAATLGDRGARLRAALAAYDEALALRRDVPLDYATTQNNRAVLLRDLASLPGEDRGARLRAALAAYDEALALLRDVPLAYATTQNNRAVLLSDLASLPGEDRGARLRAALADAASAVRIFEQSQHVQYLQVSRYVLAGVVVAMGAAEARAAWPAISAQPFPALPAELLISALAEQSGISSQEEFMARLQNDAAFRQRVEELAALAQDDSSRLQSLADRLIAWIQTPDWQASADYLRAHAAELLTDAAEAVLELLRQTNPDNRAIPQHQTLLRRCREVGIEAAYQELREAMGAAQQPAQDPLLAALDAIFRVHSFEALEQTLAQHPILAELAALERLGSGIPAMAQAQPDMALRLLAVLGVLVDRYNRAHAERVDLTEQGRFVTLCESLLAVAGPLNADLAAGLRESLGWALNTLGNAYAEQGDHAAAVEAYTRAITHAPENAMLYRNRAGEYIEMQQWAQAEADIAQAAALEPDAPRLAQLRQDVAQAVSLRT